MKLCKDCKHLTTRALLSHQTPWDMCERPIPRRYPDLVYGRTHIHLRDIKPQAERTTLDGCGPEGKFWEPTMRYRIINLFKKNDNS